MIYIKNHFIVFLEKLTLKKIMIYTILDTIFVITAGYFLTLIISNFRMFSIDFIFIVLVVNLYEMLSIIKYIVVREDSYQYEILHWLQYLVFTSVSFVYILISLRILPENIYVDVFFNLKISSLIAMVLLLGLDITLDKIYEHTHSEVHEIE